MAVSLIIIMEIHYIYFNLLGISCVNPITIREKIMQALKKKSFLGMKFIHFLIFCTNS